MKNYKSIIAKMMVIFLIVTMLNITNVKAAGSVDIAPYLYDLQSDSVYVMAVSTAVDDTLSVTLKDNNGDVINTYTTSVGVKNTMSNYSYYGIRYSYRLLIPELEPNTTYQYDAAICGVYYNNNTFKTPPVIGDETTPFKFGVWGDTQDVPLATRAAPIIQEINPLVMLHVGDLVNTGTDPKQLNKYLFGPAENLLRNSAIIPVGGNHDRGATYWQDLFPIPRTNTSSNAGNLYYTYDIGDVHFVVLHFYTGRDKEYNPLRLYTLDKDPLTGDVARVKKMLEEDAASPAATSAKYRIITMHAPLDSIRGDEWSMLIPYIKKYDPSMFFIGHKHKYNYSTLYSTEFKSIVTGLVWEGQTLQSSVPSFIEATANYYDSELGKHTLRLTPHVWDGSSTAENGSFSVRPGDITINPPTIENTPIVSTSDTTATINWETDVNTDDRVEYGLDRYLKDGLIINANSSTSHSITLENLIPGTTYSYRVKGKGTNGDIGRTDILNFTTTGIAPPPTDTPVPTPTPTPTPIPTPLPTAEAGELKLDFAVSRRGEEVNQYTYSNGTQKVLHENATLFWNLSTAGNLYNDRGSDDAYVLYKFEGTRVRLYAETGSFCGIVSVSILDSNNNVVIEEQNYDLYSEKRVENKLVYVSEELATGVYTLKARVFADRNYYNFSSNWTVNLYKIGVMGAPVITPTPTATPTATPIPFTDLEGFDWAVEYINKLSSAGVISGYPDGTFKPYEKIKRAEFATMLTKAYQILDETAVSTFTDVPTEAWYYKYVASAQKEELTVGNGDGTFAPNSFITRDEMFIFNARAMNKYEDEPILGNDDTQTAEILSNFVDGDEVSSWARGFVATNIKAGLVTGSEVEGGMAIHPKNPITRAEVSVVLGRGM